MILANSSPPISPKTHPLAAPFWIGDLKIDPPILQAPMAGFTNYPFRQIVREFGGAGLLATEMVNANAAWEAEQAAGGSSEG